MLNFHHLSFRSNPRKAIAAKASLFDHEGDSQGVLVKIVVVIRVRRGTMLRKTRRFAVLDNRSHALDSRNVISVCARVTSGSSGPSLASSLGNRSRAAPKSSLSIILNNSTQ